MDEISLDAFEDWLFPYSLNIHKEGDAEAQDLAYAIQHALGEYDEDSPELRHVLMEIVLSSIKEPPVSTNRAGDPSPVAETTANYDTVTADAA